MKKVIIKKLLICVPLGVLFFIYVWLAAVCIGELARNEYMYESFWTREGLIGTLTVSSVMAAVTLAGLLYAALKKRK